MAAIVPTRYDQDIVAWATEQAEFIRQGRFDLLDLKNIAEEIEDVGRSEKRELRNRMAELLAHILKWQYQPECQGRSWINTINNQRREVLHALKETPSLKTSLADEDWQMGTWLRAKAIAGKETGLVERFPEDCPWAFDDVLRDDWLPR